MITFLSSLGSRSTIASRISSSSCSRRSVELRSSSLSSGSSRILRQQLARAGGVVGHAPILGGQLGPLLEVAVGARGRGEPGTVTDHRRVGKLCLEFAEAREDLVYKFVKHLDSEFRLAAWNQRRVK